MKPKAGSQSVVDPVCGMQVDPAKAAATRMHKDVAYYFCCVGCAREFDEDPNRYMDRK